MDLQIDMTDVCLNLMEQAERVKWSMKSECLEPNYLDINDGELCAFLLRSVKSLRRNLAEQPGLN